MSDYSMAPEIRVSAWLNTEQPLSLRGLQGRVVLLHAFQMLCPGCVSHGVPQAERAHRLYAGDGLAVVGIHTVFEHHEAMTQVALAAFLHEYRVTHPVAVDVPGSNGPIPETMSTYRLQGTPSLMLIDRVGRLRLQEFGPVDDLQLGVLLGKLLAEQVPNTSALAHGEASEDAADGCRVDGCSL